MITFEAASKSYRVDAREVAALHPLDLSIEAGEVFGVIGQSGAGKSTLIRLINLLERPTSGRVVVDGRDVTSLDTAALRAYRRDVGMIFQHFNLLASKTVADNVAFPMRLAGTAEIEVRARVAELLARVGLSDHATKFPSQLSGGQKQRVGIARALATRPKILLCDEATSALDPQTTHAVLDLIAEINRELKLTIVLITHEMDVIRRICDRVAVLEHGRLVELGAVADVFLHPQHAVTRGLVREATGDPLAAATDAHRTLVAEGFGDVPGRILRLTFRGDATYSPTLSRLARETGVDFNVLSGRVDRIKNVPYGQLTVSVLGGDYDAARAQLANAGVHVEALQ